MNGCSKTLEISEEQNAVMAEYIADMILKYNKGYNESLILRQETDKTEETETPLTTPTASANINSSEQTENPKIDSENGSATTNYSENLSDIFNDKNLKLKYNSYAVYNNSYPENMDDKSTCVEALSGKKLLVVQFNIENSNKTSKSFDMTERKIDYRLVINGSNIFGPLITLLDNDLKFYNNVIQGNSTNASVLVYRIPQNLNIDSLQMYVKENDKTVYIKIK